MPEMPDEVRRLLDGANYVHVATTLPDGSPHCAAVWAGLEGDPVVFFTQTTARKARNLERDGRIALSVTDHEQPYRTAQVRGRIMERRRGDAAFEVVDRLAVKYTGQPFPFRNPTTIVYVVQPERWRYTELPFTHQPSSAEGGTGQ